MFGIGTPELLLIFFVVLYILICNFIGKAAEKRGRSRILFFLLSFIISPIVGAVVLFLLPKKTS